MSARSGPWAATAALALAVTLGACSSESPEENEADACAALSEYQTALDNFIQALSPDTTVDELRTAQESVESARADLGEALADVESDRLAALDEAWSTADASVDGIEGDATVADAVGTIQSEAENVDAARADLSSALNCE